MVQPNANVKRTPDEIASILMTLIRNAVARNSWDEMGGPGNIQYFPRERALIINQTQEVHEEILQLFVSLRRLQDRAVSVDLRLINASAKTAGQWRKTMTHGFVALDEAQAQQWLENARSDRANKVVQMPRVNLVNGQSIPLEFARKVKSIAELKVASNGLPDAVDWSETETVKTLNGWRCELTPVVSPDRRFVRTTVKIEHFTNDEAKSVAHSLKASKEFNVADGCTIVWDLGESAGQHLFVLATPRVRVRQQEERLF